MQTMSNTFFFLVVIIVCRDVKGDDPTPVPVIPPVPLSTIDPLSVLPKRVDPMAGRLTMTLTLEELCSSRGYPEMPRVLKMASGKPHVIKIYSRSCAVPTQRVMFCYFKIQRDMDGHGISGHVISNIYGEHDNPLPTAVPINGSNPDVIPEVPPTCPQYIIT